jgi:23S rRNA (cytosine1962-C5)-methyltransferase
MLLGDLAMHSVTLQLKKDQERRLLAGHDWIYSNEIETERTPLKGLEPGQPVELIAKGGRWLGHGYANPHSLIAVRLISRDRAHPLSAALLVERVRRALRLRERLYPTPHYRLIHGEGDGLPGLVVDRYEDLLVVQIGTAGMERIRGEVCAALEQVLRPTHILLRNDLPVREQEGLATGIDWVLGDDPGEVEVREGSLRFRLAPATGQKTGWFYDQTDNRLVLARFLQPGRALDGYCYLGGWGLQAAASGATSVVCLDSAASAIAATEANAGLNSLAGRVRTEQADLFDALRAYRDARERFETVMLDPPAFIKRRRDVADGRRAYQQLNRLGLEVLAPGGVLITSSCSFHLSRDELLQAVQRAARRAGRTLQLVHVGGQGPDHPVQPAIPETSYLKTLFLRALD